MRRVPSGFGVRKMEERNSPGSCVVGMMTPIKCLSDEFFFVQLKIYYFKYTIQKSEWLTKDAFDFTSAKSLVF